MVDLAQGRVRHEPGVGGAADLVGAEGRQQLGEPARSGPHRHPALGERLADLGRTAAGDGEAERPAAAVRCHRTPSRAAAPAPARRSAPRDARCAPRRARSTAAAARGGCPWRTRRGRPGGRPRRSRRRAARPAAARVRSAAATVSATPRRRAAAGPDARSAPTASGRRNWPRRRTSGPRRTAPGDSGRCAAAAPTSASTSAPTSCASSAIAPTSGTVPVAGLPSGTVTRRVRGVIRCSYCQVGTSPVSRSNSAHRTVTPQARAARSHGRSTESLSRRFSTIWSESCQSRESNSANCSCNPAWVAPSTTDSGPAPTRSPNARRVSVSAAAVRCERKDVPPGCVGAERSVDTIARITDSGCNVDSGPSSAAGPDGSDRYSPRTRATSSSRARIAPIPATPFPRFATLDR